MIHTNEFSVTILWNFQPIHLVFLYIDPYGKMGKHFRFNLCEILNLIENWNRSKFCN